MNTKLMFSSATDLCSTPQAFFDVLDTEFHFKLDVCAIASNAKCTKFYTKEQDALKQHWHSEPVHTIWMNPPYGRTIRTLDKEGLGDFPDGRYGSLPAPSTHRYGMVARLLA